MKKIHTIGIIIFIGILLTSCTLNTQISEPKDDSVKDSIQEDIIDKNKDDEIKNMLESMTLEEKVGQVFIVAFRNNERNCSLRVLDEKTKRQLEKYHLGGIVLFSKNIDTIPQTEKLIDDMQKTAKIPLFIAIDEEGGCVSRLNGSSKMHATKLPGNRILGQTNNPELAYEVGKLLGRELSALGINMNFAPVADVNTNPNNVVIGDRSFGSDEFKTGFMVEAMVKGMQEQNVSAVIKHFPGHGDTSLDTHKGTVVISHDYERLKQIELIPFQRGIQAEVDGVMTAHIQIPQITNDSMPATLSPEILDEILRIDLQHEGLIITDALEMGAISNYWTTEQAVVKAFSAGADILLMPLSLEEGYQGLLHAVQNGQISEERLDESVRRILYIKQKRKILDDNDNRANPEEVLGNAQHQALVERIHNEAGKKKK